MKKKIAFVFAIMILSLGFISAAPSDTILVKTNILAEEISINVPDSVVFQDIAPGYLSEKQDVYILNTGTVDISVSAELDNYIGDVFTNIGFKKILADDLVNLQYFNLEILKPTVVGGERSEGIYMYLDLTEYTGSTTENDHNASVIFTAVPL